MTVFSHFAAKLNNMVTNDLSLSRTLISSLFYELMQYSNIYLGHVTGTKCLIERFKSVILYGRR